MAIDPVLLDGVKTWHLKQCPLFRMLEEKELKDLATVSHIISFGPSEIVPLQSDGDGNIWFVKRGFLKMGYTDAGGHQAVVMLLSPSDFFGALTPIRPESFGEHCTTLTSVCLVRITRDRLETLLRRKPDVAVQLAHTSFDRIQRLQLRLAEVMMRPVEARVAMTLLELNRLCGVNADEAGRRRRLELPLSHGDLAQLVGSSREMVTYVLRRFRESGLVETSRKEIVLLDPEGLEAVRDTA